MKRLYVRFTVIFTVVAICISCYYDNEEALYPALNTSCDTTNVTFTGSIAPILANNCLTCHSNAVANILGNAIRLENYADVKVNAALIDQAIKHIGPISPMPKNGGKIRDCLITQFDIWLAMGTQNN